MIKYLRGEWTPGSGGEYGGSEPESGGLSGRLCLQKYSE